jgi:hypothetical protein
MAIVNLCWVGLKVALANPILPVSRFKGVVLKSVVTVHMGFVGVPEPTGDDWQLLQASHD